MWFWYCGALEDASGWSALEGFLSDNALSKCFERELRPVAACYTQDVGGEALLVASQGLLSGGVRTGQTAQNFCHGFRIAQRYTAALCSATGQICLLSVLGVPRPGLVLSQHAGNV